MEIRKVGVAADDPQKKEAVLEDLIVQVEIFLQYSLKTKAIEKLGKLHELFPGEEARNARLYKLYEEAQFFPPGFAESPPRGGAPTPAAPAASAPPRSAGWTPDAVWSRDLLARKIHERVTAVPYFTL